MKVNEIFGSIQGEGNYAGSPALFIRLSGCNRNCSWCDTKYHKDGTEMSERELISKIEDSGKRIIVWTGGEPCLQMDEIGNVIYETKERVHHLETNGTIINEDFYRLFDYIAVSPKSLADYQMFSKCIETFPSPEIDVKVVTDMKREGMDLLKYATMLMPLSTNNEEKDLKIKQRVWKYCDKNNLKYSPRLHVDVWGVKKRGV